MQLLTEKLVRFAEAAALIERREVQILWINADGRSDMFANQIEPRELFGVERDTCFSLIHEPFVKPFRDGVGERREHGLLFQRETDEGDEGGKAPSLGASLYLLRLCDGKASHRRSSVQEAWLSRSFFSSSLSIDSVSRCL